MTTLDTVEEAVVSGGKSLVGTVVGKVMIGIVIVLATALVLSVLAAYYLKEENTKQTAALAQRELQLGLANLHISSLQTSASATQLFANVVNEQLNQIRADADKKKVTLENYREPPAQNAVRKKPGLVELRVNRASNSMFDQLECATGSSCGPATVPPAKAGSTGTQGRKVGSGQ